MNFLLTILSTNIKDQEFVKHLNRYMSPIVETDGKYVQYGHGLMLYHFDTQLDLTGLRDYMKGFVETFDVSFILTEVNESTITSMDEVQGIEIFDFGPEMNLQVYNIVGKENNMFENFFELDEVTEEFDTDEMVQKLMKKYALKEKEPTLDEVLEKIHEEGIDSLSLQELAILKSI